MHRQNYTPEREQPRWASPAVAVAMGLALAELIARWAMGAA